MDGEAKFTIEARTNGPLVVKGARSIKGEDGVELEAKRVMVLCRCGQSRNKPFCDNSHEEVGFRSEDDATAAGRDRVIAYEGAEMTVTYNPRICSHAAECSRLAGHVFNSNEKPWVQPDKGTRAELETVIAACPSGALAFEGREHRLPEGRADIEVERNGPYWVLGGTIDAVSPGEGSCLEKFVLCRCGLSGNKPYCDGTHRDKGWKSG
ncbi:hypothetical protein DEA8626_02628 [Defluviimonas aquaemixtae]|uniref:Iron-binding zinc finger CDGSH type domain-containing protein n=1 Tax=Albidovulum aquaemixtae TaxID=1542388 RepID=A0A2R8BJL3_9RHOB|nr:CDGSH iron-sulfur domain-containing protein [Defluviimonas aquaemixtae]SPH23565.1 hypothetical protein DEA8626_02628 [Defluviimonas aquaemixtae]